MEFRTLRAEELDRWFDHCVFVFDEGRSNPAFKKYFINHLYNDPYMDLNSIHVAVDGNEIASTMRIFYRKAYFFGKEVTVGGIGEVSTKPQYQGQGLSSQLQRNAIRQMEERGTHLSMLRTGIHDFYKRLGWQPVNRYTCVATISAAPSSFRLRPADMDRDIPVLQNIYKTYSQKHQGAFVRDSDLYWRLWVKTEAANLWIIEGTDGAPAAYMIFHLGEDSLSIREFGALPAYEEIFDAAAAQLAQMMGISTMEIHFDSHIATSLDTLRLDKDDCNMYRLITPFSAGSLQLQNTADFIDALHNISSSQPAPHSDILFWEVDAY